MNGGVGVKIAVIGAGIAGLGAAWLLSRQHDVVLLEQEHYLGGHSNTVDVPSPTGPTPVDTGFIVYNTASYPNLIALFQCLDVPTAATDMSFSVSLNDGGYEYNGNGLKGLFGQRSNLFSRRHWRLTADVVRFFREASAIDLATLPDEMTLGTWLEDRSYSNAFVDDHIMPMGAAIWSTPACEMLDFPAAAFIRFFANHGLLQVSNRPEWRTVRGGSREYVRRLMGNFRGRTVIGDGVASVRRKPGGVEIKTCSGSCEAFEACLVASHADQALAMLADPSDREHDLLGAFRYARNEAVLHSDARLMPRRRRLWTSWNYMGSEADGALIAVTYWMNQLQPLGTMPDVFLTLNPNKPIDEDSVQRRFVYHHPMFDARALKAQRELWDVQGQDRIWYAGSYFGYGFHEDALQAGLAAAEAMGGVRRPWTVAEEFGPHPSQADSVSIGAGYGGGMNPISAIWVGTVVHKRLRPKQHSLRYSVFSLLLDVDRIDETARGCRLFSRNRWNAISFFDVDHGPPGTSDVAAHARALFNDGGIELGADTRILLLSYPRVLGYVFNPLSVYFAVDRDGDIAGLIYEVNNTWGERHSYVVPAGKPRNGVYAHEVTKHMFVSPFIEEKGHYTFRVSAAADELVVAVMVHDREGPLLKTYFKARAKSFGDRALSTLLLRFPLMTMKVTAGIHLEALRLWLKGVPLVSGHSGPKFSVTNVEVTKQG